MRNEKVDILRCVGLSCIILAHIQPPPIVFQARNFDVPLMVLISGVVFNYSRRKETPYREYILSRIPRLYLPVGCFLTLLFPVIYLLAHLFNRNYPFDLRDILSSYALLSGIGYVWVIRVFIVVALVAPWVKTVSARLESDNAYLALILGFLLIDSLCLPWFAASEVIKETVLYLIPYACVFALGMRLDQLSKRTILLIGSVSFLLFLGFSFWLWLAENQWIGTQTYKYPPHIYYLSYAISISLFAYITANSMVKLIGKMKLKQMAVFIGQNSMWIYLWHIFALELRTLFNLEFESLLASYAYVYLLAIGLTTIQRYWVNQVLQYYRIEGQNKKFILSVLTG